MKTRAAVVRKAGTPWEITELELDAPQANEVLIRMEAAGLCHSDEHIRAAGMARLPMVGGHEGAGTVRSRTTCMKVTAGSRNSSPTSTPWTKLTTATRILWMVGTSAASSCTSIEASATRKLAGDRSSNAQRDPGSDRDRH